LVEDEGIRIIHILGRFERKILNEVISPDKGITSRVVRNRIAEYVPDVTQDPDYFSISSATRSQITVPLLSGEELVGVLTLEARNPDQFTPEIFETLKLMVNRVGVAIDNARLYEETDQLVKELDAFAHTVAHDLKNPLAIIMAYAGMINADYPEGKLGEFSSAMVKSSQKAAGIIDALLLLAGVRSMQTMEVVPLAMGTIVNDVHARFVNLIDEYQPEIILPDQWLEAKGYGPWAEEIWANYFSNAIKYGGRPPRVELGSNRLDDGQIRFWMRDNGKGLTAEEQAQLFRPFTRLGQTDVKGHGLGLSIVQRIAERLNGDVGVESIVGQGSLFYFTLPAA
jgi:signal transduction histidine kinase